MVKNENNKRHLCVSITPPLSQNISFYCSPPHMVDISITNNCNDTVLIQSVIVRFRNDAYQSSIYAPSDDTFILKPSDIYSLSIPVSPTAKYFDKTNDFDVLVDLKLIRDQKPGPAFQEIYPGSFILIDKFPRTLGKLFISFKQPENLQLAKIFKTMAERAGFSAFVIEKEPQTGLNFRNRIEVELKTSVALVVIWTDLTKWSEWVKREINFCRQEQVPDILLLQRGLEIPELYKDSQIQYRIFDPDNPYDEFDEVIDTWRNIVLKCEELES